MASNFETGHAVNLQRKAELISAVQQLGPGYAPSRQDLSVQSLGATLAAARTLHEQYTGLLQQSRVPINNRQALFAGLDPLLTRV